MGLKRGLSLALVAAAVALAATAVAGCGGGSASGNGGGSENSQTYGEVLKDLKKAALAKTTYNAVRHAEGLDEVDKTAIAALCDFAWQIGANREAAKLSEHEYIDARIRLDIETKLEGEKNDATPAEIKAAMEKIRSVVDLPSLDGDLTNRYSKACTH